MSVLHMRSTEQPTLSELQELVGGYIEVVQSHDGSADIIFDEEGKLKDKQVNISATTMWLGEDKTLWHDVIVGDVVVCRGNARLT